VDTETRPLLSRVTSLPLELARVRLRRIEQSDVDALFAIYSNAEVSRYLSYPPWTERKQAEAWVERIFAGREQGSSLQLAVERKEGGEMIGTCTLFNCHEESRRAEIGYALHRAHWGAGYMHETLVALVDLAFKTLGLNRLEADIDPRNAGSKRSLERLGFRSEGRLRERWIVNGEVSDTEYLGLLSAEWKGGSGS
jgi:RimJ/RimL family protein N-acetyltransferase